MSTKATLYIEDQVYRAYKIKAAETDQTLSELVTEALRAQMTEELEDIQIIRDRTNNPTESYETFLKGLSRDGLI
jgi:hypothetical protein